MVVVVVCLLLVAGFGGFVERCEIGVRPEDLPPEASLAVDFDGDADFYQTHISQSQNIASNNDQMT